jgi:hypothetical protein
MGLKRVGGTAKRIEVTGQFRPVLHTPFLAVYRLFDPFFGSFLTPFFDVFY